MTKESDALLRLPARDGCGVCAEQEWGVLSTCCAPHGRTICESCYIDWLDEAWPPDFDEPCPVNWDLVDAPPVEDCVAGLRLMLAEL